MLYKLKINFFLNSKNVHQTKIFFEKRFFNQTTAVGMLLVSPLFTRFDQKPTQSAAFRTGPGLPNPSCTVNLILVYMACFYCYQHQFYCNRSSNPALLLTPKGRQHMLQMWFSRYHQIHCCLKSLNCVSQK